MKLTTRRQYLRSATGERIDVTAPPVWLKAWWWLKRKNAR